jgi:hypothetical protein
MSTAALTHPSSSSARHECKFIVPVRNLARVQALLNHLCATDPSFQSNIINSLYFDTDRLELLRQKEASEFLKRKVRIRWYVDPLTGTPGPQAFLEVKTKQGARGGKVRTALPIPAAAFDRDPLAAAETLSPHLLEGTGLEGVLRDVVPACVIQYRRRRYIEMSTGHRIALDSDIRACSLNRALLRERRESRPSYAVLEVKGPGARDLPPSLSLLHRWGVEKSSFSKYAACLDGEHPMETDPL